MGTMDIKYFLEIEKKYDLYHLEIDGVNVWEYARFDLWNYNFCSEALNLQNAHRKEKNIPAFEIIKNFISSYLKYLFAFKKNVDVCFIPHERRVKVDEFYDCMYTEELIKNYPNSVVLEKPHKYTHLIPIRTANMYYTDWIIITGNVYAKIHKMVNTPKYKKIYAMVERELHNPVMEMKDVYHLQIGLDKIVKACVEKYFICKLQYGMYERLLKKCSPKVIVEVCHYSRQSMLINEIAKKLNIPTIELQHGTMHSEHAAYQYQTDREIAQLPDEIFMFSEYWKTQIHMPLSNDKLITTGFPYFEQKKEQYIGARKETDKKTILFVSQGTIGKELGLLAVRLSEKIDSSKYRIVYKLHPGEYVDWEKNYPELANADIEVIDNSETNLYEYFSNADVQIGVYSTAMYEGLGFGLKTIIYNIGHADTMASLVEQGYAVLVNDVDEVISELEKEDKTVEGAVFWKMNSLENITALLDKIMM